MASRESTGNKMKSKGQKPSRASAMPPNPPAPLRAQGGATTMVPKPPLAGGAPGKVPEKMRDKAAKTPKDGGAGDAGGPEPLKKQELIAKVVERSDVAKKHAKPVIEAMLAVLGDALAEGRDLNLQPMGKIKRKRVKETVKARVIVANIRQPLAAGAGAGSPAAPLPGSTPGSIQASLPNSHQGSPIAPARHPLKEAVADDKD